MDFTKQSQVIISFCTGVRGLDRGLERAFESLQWPKPRTAFYVENEMFCIANLVAAMETGMVDCAPIWTDAKTFNPRPFHRKIHGIIGGYPCQKFSLAGKREGLTEGHVWNHIERSIEAIKPLWCFFENVDDHLSLGFDIVYKSLSNLGYKVEAGIYSAAEVGAPHERKRLFILAIANGIELKWPRSWKQERNSKSSDGCSLANSKSIKGRLSIRPGQQGQKEIESFGTSEELADTDGLAAGREAGLIQTEIGKTEIDLQQREWRRDESIGSGSELADTNSSGSEQDRQQAELRAISTEQSSCNCGGTNEGENLQEQWQGWPARPGEQQHEWEEPRTVEPGMGSAINGYNFREDLLRALGNSVVEQTAELAFKDLVRKHIETSKKLK